MCKQFQTLNPKPPNRAKLQTLKGSFEQTTKKTVEPSSKP